MIFTTAYLVQVSTEEDKLKLKSVGATWSLGAQGWFLTEGQKNQLETIVMPKTTPSGVIVQTMNIDPNIPEAGSEWKVTGNTFHKRDLIKSLGGRWKPQDRSWRIPLSVADTQEALEAMLA